MIVALLRHALTDWNEVGRLQGRADIPLSPRGRAQVASWRLPADIANARIVSSPLARAVETARLLTGQEPAIVPALAELDWGAWEGETFARLHTRHAVAFAAAEAHGLDFRPPGGESYRELQQRLLGWLAAVAAEPGPVLAVTHNGVLKVTVAHLTGWNAIGRPPVNPRSGCLHRLEIDAAGRIVAHAWNEPLAPDGR